MAITMMLNELLALLNNDLFWTIVQSIGTIFPLVFLYKQVRDSSVASAYNFMEKIEDQWWNKYKNARSIIAEESLRNEGKNELECEDEIHDILCFFEDLGLLCKKNAIPAEFVWNSLEQSIFAFDAVLTPYILKFRCEDKDPNLYTYCEYLFKQVAVNECKMNCNKKLLDNVKELLREELKSHLNIQTRTVCEEDFGAICRIEHLSFNEADAYTKDDFIKLYQEHPEGFIVVEVNGVLCGYTSGYVLNEEYEIDSIAVSPFFRRMGIADVLIKNILISCKKLSCQKCSLEVKVTNDAAISLYDKYGFEKIAYLDKYYDDGEDAIRLQKIIFAN